jgi:hypothetical protein
MIREHTAFVAVSAAAAPPRIEPYWPAGRPVSHAERAYKSVIGRPLASLVQSDDGCQP